MKLINWDLEKNIWLRENRNICFEDIVYYLDNGYLIDDTEHPNPKKYPDQKIFVFNINEYIWLVPYIESHEEIFLKTIIPSRKATKRYLGGKNET
jgi:uncharacterized DUF497 family protein